MRYLLITYTRKAGGQIDEQIGFAAKLKTNDLQTCNVVLDYEERKILKCVVEGKIVPTDWDRMNNYYRQVYPEIVGQLELINQEKRENAK
jgi:hypothetical protein